MCQEGERSSVSPVWKAVFMERERPENQAGRVSMKARNTMDLTTGSVSKKLITFAFPLIMSLILQQLYNAADKFVVGRFSADGTSALAAVGSTGSSISLILGLFAGISVGANIVCANLKGARKEADLRRCMHTAVPLSVIFGVIVLALGVLLSKPLLQLMNVPKTILDKANLYMVIYFLGAPVSLLYNFGSAILRAHGDTKRPMIILAVSGLVNVLLNFVLVCFCGMGVEGVALGTIAAQAVSAVWVVCILFSPRDAYKLKLREIRIHPDQLRSLIRIGVPCCFNGIAFSLSNLVLQSAVNGFGPVVIAGNTAGDSFMALCYQILAGFYSACVSFAGQCYGARKYKRIDQLLITACIWSVGVCLVSAVLGTLFPRQFIGLFDSDPEVITAGIPKFLISCWGYMIYGVSEVILGCLRGLKESTVPTAINLLGICVSRMIWIWIFFPLNPTPGMIYVCYPISWALSAIGLGFWYIRTRKRLNKTLAKAC